MTYSLARREKEGQMTLFAAPPPPVPQVDRVEDHEDVERGFPDGPFELPIRDYLPLLILSCSATKNVTPGFAFWRFLKVYDGPMWRQVKASSFPEGNVAALSAGYGFLEPGMPIRSYDTEMDEDRSRAFIHTSNHCFRLRQAVAKAKGAFVVGGGMYQAIARAAMAGDALEATVAYAEGNFLQQRKQLGEFLAAHTAKEMFKALVEEIAS